MALDPQLYRTPLLDPRTGGMSREWVRFFDQLATGLQWTPWTPVMGSSGGMGISSVSIFDAQYLKEGTKISFKLYCSLTLAGSSSNQVRFSLPVPIVGMISSFQATIHPPASGTTPGWGYCDPGGNVGRIMQAGEANYTLGANDFLAQGFYRCA